MFKQSIHSRNEEKLLWYDLEDYENILSPGPAQQTSRNKNRPNDGIHPTSYMESFANKAVET